MNKNIKLYFGDCLEGMAKLPDKSIDMILCDLPYGSTRSKWDKIIPFEELWKQYIRITKENSAIVLFGNEPFSSLLRSSNLDMYKYDWKWLKNNVTGFTNANYRPMKVYEDICVFSKTGASSGGKNNPMKYYPQGLIEVNKPKKNTAKRMGLITYANTNINKDNIMLKEGSEYIQKYTNYPVNILQFDGDSKKVHPTQKPVTLLEYLIKTYTKENEIVLDNCMGSGSTGVACIHTNRKFVGMEKDEKYYNIAKDRIEKENEVHG